MTYIVSYQKFINSERTVELALPSGDGSERKGQELATVDGVTYVAVFDEPLPEQPSEITVSQVTVTPSIKKLISENSPIIKLINQTVVDKISAKYSVNDEIKLLRTQPSAEFTAYNEYVESCRADGAQQKSALGL
jgi:hypothetical protein